MTQPIHKLAVIVFTDIVGFTKLTATNPSRSSMLNDSFWIKSILFLTIYIN